MTDELARKYEELKLREAEAKEKKEQEKKALKKGCMATIQIALVLFLAIIAYFTESCHPFHVKAATRNAAKLPPPGA